MCQLLCLYVVDILKDYAGDNFNEAGAPRLIAANLVFFAISFFDYLRSLWHEEAHCFT